MQEVDRRASPSRSQTNYSAYTMVREEQTSSVLGPARQDSAGLKVEYELAEVAQQPGRGQGRCRICNGERTLAIGDRSTGAATSAAMLITVMPHGDRLELEAVVGRAPGTMVPGRQGRRQRPTSI